jgi:hypothetical protein
MQGALGIKDAESVDAILAKKGFGAKGQASARRTEKQESAYTAARQALKRVRKSAGVNASDARGGDTSKAKTGAAGQTAQSESKTADSKSGKAEPATMIPAAASAKDAAAFLLAYANKNAKTFKGAEGKALERAIHAFNNAQAEPDH